MSTTVDSIRRVKTGENVVFELIKKENHRSESGI